MCRLSYKGVIGVNVQYFGDNDIFQVNTLSIKEIFTRHTSPQPKILISSILNEYKIILRQIYIITIDNSRNLIKALEILHIEVILEDIENDSGNEMENEVNINTTEVVSNLESELHEEIERMNLNWVC